MYVSEAAFYHQGKLLIKNILHLKIPHLFLQQAEENLKVLLRLEDIFININNGLRNF